MFKDDTEPLRNQASDLFGFTQFPNREASRQHYQDGRFSGLAKLIRNTAAVSKDELPWLKLARFAGKRSPQGSLRYDAAVLQLTGCEGDYDGEQVSVEDAAGKLQAAGIEALLYETASSKPGAPRWRVICPAARPHSGDTADLRTLRWSWVARVNGVLGGILAPESFVLSQAYYFGNVEGQAPRIIRQTEGARIDTRDDLDTGALYQNGRNTPPEPPTFEPSDIDFEETNDDPDLLDAAERIKAAYLAKHGRGTKVLGHRGRNLAQMLGDLGTRAGHILSAEAIQAGLGDDFPVPLAEIERWLSPAGRQSPRGCQIIDPDPEEDPEIAEALAAQEAEEAKLKEPTTKPEPGPKTQRTEQGTAGTEGVSFQITHAQKRRLRDLGYSAEQLREMTPAEARAILDRATEGGKGAAGQQSTGQDHGAGQDTATRQESPTEEYPADLAKLRATWARAGLTEEQITQRTARHLKLEAAEAETTTRKSSANRFFAALRLKPSEQAKRPPVTYIDDEQILPRVPGGCVGLAIGQQGSHKTGLFVALGLQAIEQHGDRVLYIAAEDAHGVETARLPAAAKARKLKPEILDKHWRTIGEDGFQLLQASDREDLVKACRQSFMPTLVFIDVLTKVAPGDINAPQTAAEIMNAAEELARAFGAVVVISHHPGKDEKRGGMGSNLLISRTYFQWTLHHKDGVVRVHIDKLKGGVADRTLRYLVESGSRDVPVIRVMSPKEITAHRAGLPPQPDLDAENATDNEALAKLDGNLVRVLKQITKPTLLRDAVLLMLENDPTILERHRGQLSQKDAETLTDDEVRDRCREARYRQLKRAVGTDALPGTLAPFVQKVKNSQRREVFATPFRLMPLSEGGGFSRVDLEREVAEALAAQEKLDAAA